MFRKRHFLAGYNFKTGLLSKIFLIFGVLLLIIYLILKAISIFIVKESRGFYQYLFNVTHSSIPETLLALSLILIAVGIIFTFFDYQFTKLRKIAEDVEKNNKKQ